MLELWRKHICIAGLSLRHEVPNVFITSQWQKNSNPNVYYMAYRIIITVYLLIAWLLSIIDEENLGEPYPFHLKWLIYLTNWGFTFCTFQAVLCTGMLFTCFFKARKADKCLTNNQAGDSSTSRLYKLYWMCFTIAIDVSFAVTILYWVVIYNPDVMPLDYLNILVHCTNSAAMLLELSVVGHPVRLMHFYLPVCIGLVYSLFSLFYYLAGGTSRIDEPYIYSVVDWSKPIPTVLVCLGASVFIVVLHIATYLLCRIRIAIANKLMQTENDRVNIPVQEEFRGFDNDCLANDPV